MQVRVKNIEDEQQLMIQIQKVDDINEYLRLSIMAKNKWNKNK